jgi:hypothetical protein
MNKKGQQVFVGIMIAIMLFIVMVQFIDPIKTQVQDARSDTKLDCTNTSISVGTKMTCIVTDLYLFYFFGVGIAISIAFIGGRALIRKFQQ